MKKDEVLCAIQKWKKLEFIALAIDIVLLFIFIALSIVKQLTDFNSIAYFVLTVIFGVIMIADVVTLFVCWFKLFRIGNMIADLEVDNAENNNDI